MKKCRDGGLVQINAKITPKQKAALDKIHAEKDCATFTDALRYALRKGIEVIEMN